MGIGDVMSVLINKKRCDNADACSCIEGCPTKAFYWDSEKGTIAVDNNLCINCRNCMISCEAGAVKVARDEEEYQKIKTDYDEDIMTVEELFQDRYGATLVEEKYALDLGDLKEVVENSNKPLLIEFYSEEEAKCLINSIPVKEIIDSISYPVSYRKVNISNVNDLKEFGIEVLPALLIIENGKVIYKWEQFVKVTEKEMLLKDIKEQLDFVK